MISFSYYTGAYPHDLVERADIPDERSLDWSVTDIVPKKDIDSVDTGKPLLVITTKEGIANLQKKWPGNWQQLGEGYKQQLYYREAEEREL